MDLQNSLWACGVLLNRMYLGEGPGKTTEASSKNEKYNPQKPSVTH